MKFARKQRKCRICKMGFIPLSMGHVVCGKPECVKEHIRRVDEKATKRRQKAERIADKAKRESLKTRSDWLKDAQKAVNRYVRIRDHDKPCISCGAVNSSDLALTGGYWDAGHYRSVGSSPSTRFYLHNIAKQCKRCNRDLGGRVVDFRAGLVGRIGIEKVEYIEAMQVAKKFDIDYLKRITSIFTKKTKRTMRWLEFAK